jgi:hypothetical protein
LNSDLLFQRPNLLAQRRLPDMEACRRARKVHLFRRGHEVPQMPEFHIQKQSNRIVSSSQKFTQRKKIHMQNV